MAHNFRTEHLVVVGGGQAATQLMEVARQEGYEGSITLITDESVLPYQRPPLSKSFLVGDRSIDWLLYRPEKFYKDFDIKVRLGCRVVEIDRAAGRIRMHDGSSLPYDKLALVTGSRATRLDIEGSTSERIFYVRTLADTQALQLRLADCRRILIVGGGFIGLEAAAVLGQRGYDVSLLAAHNRLIPRVLTPVISNVLLNQHISHGVQVYTNSRPAAIHERAGGQVAVTCSDGRTHLADLIIVGVGARPNTELAERAGLECDNGIVVDEFTQTSDPAIFAAGDCTNHPNAYLSGRLRLETVHNAVEQGRTAGATISGRRLPYHQTPWVWSDQYGLRIQSVGISTGFDLEVVRGNASDERFSTFYFRQGELIAANSINEPAIFGAARKILNNRVKLDPQDAKNRDFDIRTLVPNGAKFDFEFPWPERWEKHGAAINWGHA